MSGHSKWANIQHRKGAQDAKRGKIFQKLSKEIMVAAQRGASPESNSALRLAISKARSASMPKDNIKRAIAKGSGTSKDAATFIETFYAGTISKGVQLVVVCLTDNFNRLSATLKSTFNRGGGQLGKQNSIPFVFEQKGVIDIQKDLFSEDEMINISLEVEAENMEIEDDYYHLTFPPSNFLASLEKIKEITQKEEFLTAEVSYLATSKVELNQEESEKVLNFIERLEDDDDIQAVYHNLA